MKRWMVPFGSLTAIVVGVIVALAVAGVFGSDDASGDKAQGEGDENVDTAALCVEGAEDCDDMIEAGDGGGDDAARTCLAGEPECNDTPDVSQLCAEDVPDCEDTGDEPAPAPDDPVTNDNPLIPPDNDCAADVDACKERVIEIARADLRDWTGAELGTVLVESAEYQEWPNACLGVAGPNDLCAEVITPGFVIVLQANGQGYEYHADLTGESIKLAE